MQNKFDPAVYWPGKIQSRQMARLNICVKFDLWQDHMAWVEPERRHNLWFGDRLPENQTISIQVSSDGKLVHHHDVTGFGTIQIAHEIDDEIERDHVLTVRFVGINGLPVRNDHGHFVCGMFEIQSVQLQGEEIIDLLANTFFGQDQAVDLCFQTPVYRFMVNNRDSIWPKQFDHILERNMNHSKK